MGATRVMTRPTERLVCGELTINISRHLEGIMLRNIKTGASLIAIGLFTLVTTYPVTEGSVFFFTTLISMVLVLLGLLQFWIDSDGYIESENRYANKNIN